MRLGQLSRKIGISTSEIIKFLTANNITINDDSNTKIEDEYANFVTKKYAPHLLQSMVTTIADEKAEEVKIETLVEEVETDEPKEQVEESVEQLLPEVIKAPKIELSGLKVLGKIDLPEKRKMEEEVATDKEVFATGESIKPERKPQPRREFVDRPVRNPIAVQREREEREAIKKRKEQTQKEKEKKTYNYLSKVQVKAPIKKARHTKEEFEEVRVVVAKKEPTTLWGRFMKWLNT